MNRKFVPKNKLRASEWKGTFNLTWDAALLCCVCFSIARRETSAIHRLHGVPMTMRSVRNPQRLSDFATRISPQDCFCMRSPLLVFFLSLLSTSRKKSQPKSRAVIILEKYRIPTKYYSIRHVYYRVFPQYFHTGYFSSSGGSIVYLEMRWKLQKWTNSLEYL